MNMPTKLDGWFWGNIVLGGFIGSTTDGISGAYHQYEQSQYMVTLVPVSTDRMNQFNALPEENKIKDYIVTFYSEIMREVKSKSPGEKLKTLFGMLNVEEKEFEGATKKMDSLSQLYTDAPVFADHVIELFRAKKT